MKNSITVERLKELVQEYITLRNDEMENSTEWAYVMLEPDLIANEEVTQRYLMHINKDEFDVLGEDHWFEHIVGNFKSQEMLNIIQMKYKSFFGESTDTEFYREAIAGLRDCIKGQK